MNIELKYKVKYHFTVTLLAALTLIFGAIGIYGRVEGLIMLPVISGFLATLMCIEKRRVASIIACSAMVIGEIIFGFMGYFTLTSLSAVIIAIIISVYYTKKKDKSECALFCTLALSLIIPASALIYIFGTTEVANLSEAYEYFLSMYYGLKEMLIESTSIAQTTPQTAAMFTPEYISTVFDAYLYYMVAMIAIIAFLLVGLALKIFTGVMARYSQNRDDVTSWHFIPSSVFAYFYFAVAILSMFATNPDDVISLSTANLYLIFMFVFAYVGYRFISSLMSKNARRPIFISAILLILILYFSNIALQILAVAGAFMSVNYAKLVNNKTTNNTSNDRR